MAHSIMGESRQDRAVDNLGWEHMKLGCLMRLANAVERIANVLDPRTRPEIVQEAQAQRAAVDQQALWTAWDAFVAGLLRQVQGSLRSRFRGLDCPYKSQLLRLVAGRILERQFGHGWAYHGLEEVQATGRPLAEVFGELRQQLDFRPDDFDWAQLRLGPVSRARLDGLLAGREVLANGRGGG